MAVQINMKVNIRDQFGKELNGRMRRKGLTPAILFGSREKALPLYLDTNEFLRLAHGELHENTIYNLEIESMSNEPVRAIIKELQFDPVSDKLLHIDFYEMTAGKVVSMEVPIEAVGEARGVKVSGGYLEHVMREVTIQCLPKYIPDLIKVDVSNLDAGDAIHIKDIEVPEGVTIINDPGKVIFSIVHPKGATAEKEEISAEEETKTT